MITGIVKWYSVDKGYGFIAPDTRVNGGDDVFVHVSALAEIGLEDLPEGTRVGFEMGTSKRTGRACAANLKLV